MGSHLLRLSRGMQAAFLWGGNNPHECKKGRERSCKEGWGQGISKGPQTKCKLAPCYFCGVMKRSWDDTTATQRALSCRMAVGMSQLGREEMLIHLRAAGGGGERTLGLQSPRALGKKAVGTRMI